MEQIEPRMETCQEKCSVGAIICCMRRHFSFQAFTKNF